MPHLLIDLQGAPGDSAAQERVSLRREVLTIGRATSNDLTFQDPWLSRLHAKIIPRDGDFVVADAGSRNGTYLNGRRLAGEEGLTEGDIIALGDVRLRYVDDAPSGHSRDVASKGVGALHVGGSETPLPEDGTVLIPSNDLEFTTYREPEEMAGEEAAGASLLPILTRTASALIHHHPLPDLLELVLDLVFESVRAERGALLLGPPGGDLRVKAVRGFDGGDVQISRTLIQEVLEKRQAVLTVDAQRDDRFENADSILIEGIRAIICVPLWNNREVIGLLYLDQRVKGEAFTRNDLRVSGLVANLAAVKIENVRLLEEKLEKERMEEQLALGAKIQRRLLPSRPPEIPGYEIRGENRSCWEVGGDYFDFVPKRDGKLAVVIADISGKGVGAAILMAALQASVRSLVHLTSDPVVLVSELNTLLIENSPENKYATLFYAELDPETHVLEYVNGGHVPALLAMNGTIQELEPTGPIVGLFDEALFERGSVALEDSGTLLLYTDGISELENSAGEEFGTERLRSILECRPAVSADNLISTIRRELDFFDDTERPFDDRTLVVLRREP